MNATYALKEIQSKVTEEQYHITISALQGAQQMGLGQEDITECISELQDSHFYKTMPSEKIPGLWQDVYRVRFLCQRVYLKVQISVQGYVKVISFKEDDSI